MTITKVLIIGENTALRTSLEEQLQLHDEFVVIGSNSLKNSIQLIKEHRIDIIVCDDRLSEMTAGKIFGFLRQHSFKLPIIMLFDATVEPMLLEKFSGSKDSYITKPFKLSLLIERLRTSYRYKASDSSLEIGPYKFMLGSNILTHKNNQKTVRLTEKEAAILKHLHRCNGKVVLRETLLGEVWDYSADATTHTIETHVYRLRQKIEENPSCAKILVTERGGYRLKF